jgi:hypothetical protein
MSAKAPASQAAQNIAEKFPEDLRGILSFECQANAIIIKPKQFLGSENFAKTASIVKTQGGDYVSDGKGSHFRIPLAPTPTQEKPPQVPEKVPASPPTNLHFKVTKLTVALGTTIQHSETEWNKRGYALEMEVNSSDKDIVEKAKAEAEQFEQSWLSEPTLPPAEIPQIDMAELNECPWVTFKDKQPAKPGHAAWIKNPVEFTSWKDVPKVLLELVKIMKRDPDQKLVLGDMEYVFSGDKKQFIQRKPVKTETAK